MHERFTSPIRVPVESGGGAPDFGAFREGIDDTTRFEVISYPGWRRYVADDFSAEALVAELAARIVEAIPDGPIFIIGLSIGGHLGYAIALLLKKQGRENRRSLHHRSVHDCVGGTIKG